MSRRPYTVHRRPVPGGAEPDLALVKDGICWPALFVPLLWALYRRLWLGAFLYLALSLGLMGLAAALELGEAREAILLFGLNWLAALEANDWRRRALAKAGYVEAGVVLADSLDEAERRAFESGLHQAPAPAAAAPRGPRPLGRVAALSDPFATTLHPGARP